MGDGSKLKSDRRFATSGNATAFVIAVFKRSMTAGGVPALVMTPNQLVKPKPG